MRTILQDIRYCLRMLAAHPTFTVAAVVCLALGIGSTTAIFSVVNTVLLRPLPYHEPDQLVRLYTEFPEFPKGGLNHFWMSPPEFDDLQHNLKSWATLEAWTTGGANLSGGGTSEPVRITVAGVTGGMLPTLGVSAIAGRVLTPKDDETGAPKTAVLSYGLWQRVFGGDKSVIGRDVQLNGRATTIVGVMPSSFQFPAGEVDPSELWTPLQLGPPNPQRRGNHYLSILGRLKPGTSIEVARQEMAQYVRVAGENAAPNYHEFSTKRHPLSAFALHEEVTGGVRKAVLMLLGAVGFVLVIACVNVANLLLARAESRRREIAVRQTIGAGVGRLLRQLVTEGLILSGLGAVFGIALAYVGLRVLITAGADSIPLASEVHLDPLVLLVALAVTLATGVFFGVAPVLTFSPGNLYPTLKSASGRTTSGTGSRHFRRALVVIELALALVLLIGNGLMVRAFWKLLSVNAGINPEHVLTLRVALPATTYTDSVSSVRFWTDLEGRVRSLPGVTSVATVSGLPPTRPVNANDTDIEGFVAKPGGPIQNIDYWQFVGTHYFETMGIRQIEGRPFDDRDGIGSQPTAVINKTFAQMYWPGESAIGHRVRPPIGNNDPWYTIVGVVDDVKNAGVEKPTGTELYLSIPQFNNSAAVMRTGYLAVKTTGDPMALAPSVREAIRGLDSALPVSAVRSMQDVIAASETRPRFLTLLLSLFSGTALVLSAVGVYGVISYAVAQRTNEFGLRMALGAQRGRILQEVLGNGFALGLVGVLVGIAVAFTLTRLMSELLFGISTLDPLTFVLMPAVLLGVTLAACYAPARRATKVDPGVALRYE